MGTKWTNVGCMLILLFSSSVKAQISNTELKLHVSPSEMLLMDESEVVVEGATPGGLVTIEANLIDAANVVWTSKAAFYADIEGKVDVTKAVSHAGT